MKKKILETMVPLALVALYNPSAFAQATPTGAVDTAPTAAPVAAPEEKVETVVVTGFPLQPAKSNEPEAAGHWRARLDRCRRHRQVPEANVAESLQRVPGVILNRDEISGEGQRISIRGLPTDYSVTTLNGAPVNTTSTSTIGSAARGFNYDVFASELFGRVDFYKSPLAELTEGGLGGVVDLQTPRPFDNPKRTIRYGGDRLVQHHVQAQRPERLRAVLQHLGQSGFPGRHLAFGQRQHRSGFEATGGYNSSFRGSQSPVKGNFALALDLRRSARQPGRLHPRPGRQRPAAAHLPLLRFAE
jgi:iron complex outermembrane receptor protein